MSYSSFFVKYHLSGDIACVLSKSYGRYDGFLLVLIKIKDSHIFSTKIAVNLVILLAFKITNFIY